VRPSTVACDTDTPDLELEAVMAASMKYSSRAPSDCDYQLRISRAADGPKICTVFAHAGESLSKQSI